MKLKCRLDKDIYVFDEWQFVSLWGFRQEDQYKSWVRFLLTKNGKPVVAKESVLFSHCNLDFNPEALYNKPALEIEETISPEHLLFFRLSNFDFDILLDAALTFRKWEDELLPFPKIYTPAGDYEKAKQHCDRFMKTITNLPVFL